MAQKRKSYRPPNRVDVEPVEPRVLWSAAAVGHPAMLLRATPKHRATPVADQPIAHTISHTVSADPPKLTAGGGRKAARRARRLAAEAMPSALPGSATPTGKMPAQLRQAYGVGSSATAIDYRVKFAGVNGDGAGQTIALVVAYNAPSATADLHTFSQYYDLPDAPGFQVLNQLGATGPLPADDPYNSSWSEEAALDVQWAHAMAPAANLILYEANGPTLDDLYQAAKTAAANPAVSVVSMSFGAGEYAGGSSLDAVLTTPAGRSGGVTFLAATGDDGAGVNAPAEAATVVAVGGTTLNTNGAGYASETAWSGSGGGVSAYTAQPAYQAGIVSAYSTTKRTIPDVSAVADPNTGVSICSAYDFGASTPWLGGGYQFGGTSLATPLWAGLVAMADQGRAVAGLPSLDSATGTLPRLYQLPASDYHDVTTGTSGNAAGVGYDLVTGRGSPAANSLVADLAGVAAVSGRAYVDHNGNAAYEAGTDAPLAGRAVFLDYDNDGVRDHGEPSATTSAAGTYSFADVPAGGTVRAVTPAGYAVVPSGTSAAIAYGTGTAVDFAYFPTTFTAGRANDQYALQTDAAGTTAQVLLNGTVTDSIATSRLPTTLSFALVGSGAGLTVSAANGNPLPSGGLAVAGTAGRANTLAVVGSAGNDAWSVSATAVSFSSVAITTANVAVTLDPSGGTDTLTVASGGAATIVAGPAGGGVLARRFAGLSVAANATLTVAAAASAADRQVLVASALAVNGTLALADNDLIVRNSDLAVIGGLARAALSGAPGLASPANATRLTTFGVARPLGSTFDGQPVSSADVVVKFTLFGDANLDGVVNLSDYTRVDTGFVLHLTGWADGDLNYDGVVDASDYTLIDNAFARVGHGT